MRLRTVSIIDSTFIVWWWKKDQKTLLESRRGLKSFKNIKSKVKSATASHSCCESQQKRRHTLNNKKKLNFLAFFMSSLWRELNLDHQMWVFLEFYVISSLRNSKFASFYFGWIERQEMIDRFEFLHSPLTTCHCLTHKNEIK